MEKIDFGMSRFMVEMKMGHADKESFSEVSNERWYTYVSSYEGKSTIKVTQNLFGKRNMASQAANLAYNLVKD